MAWIPSQSMAAWTDSDSSCRHRRPGTGAPAAPTARRRRQQQLLCDNTKALQDADGRGEGPDDAGWAAG